MKRELAWIALTAALAAGAAARQLWGKLKHASLHLRGARLSSSETISP
jgi:hypothetical protein